MRRGGRPGPTSVLSLAECPDLTTSQVVRLLLAPEIPAQGERRPAVSMALLTGGFISGHFFLVAFSLLFLCWLFCFTNEALHEG